MTPASRDFQVFAKPIGAACNLACDYCYYSSKENLYPKSTTGVMPDDLLEQYIRRHIQASPSDLIRFAWHGGEPSLLGADFFTKALEYQKRYRPKNRKIVNGIQTNGVLVDDKWAAFFRRNGFSVGISLDGPEEFHDSHRRDKSGAPTHERVLRGFRLLKEHDVQTDVLCVVNSQNVRFPEKIYRYFKRIGASRISFLPLVEPNPGGPEAVTPDSVLARAFGEFLCIIFDEWKRHDVGRVKIEIFEEAARIAFGLEPSVCVFRKTCGDVPVVERNGDVYSCDHFVRPEYLLGNIRGTGLAGLLDSPAQVSFGRAKQDSLPDACRQCEVLASCNGGCVKDRFVTGPDGERGLNYLCPAYKMFFFTLSTFCQRTGGLEPGQDLRAERGQTRKSRSQ